MKYIIQIYILVFLIPIFGFSQTFVSTTAENKNVVLEEFTGIYCGFCPDGHVLAQALHDAYPNDVFLINIHTGGYANPNGPSDPDFRTIYGGAIGNASGLAGYPAGTINRSTFSSIAPQGAPGSTALSRGDWAAAAALIMADPSEVNVAAQASYDMGTGILTVNTESYFTATGTSGTYNLHVAVVMNNVAGPQSGASNYNPGAIIPGPWSPTYNHQHMMVHLMNGATGLAFTSSTAGTFVPNTHTWTVPAQMQGEGSGSTTGFFPDHDPTNFDVVAFVTESATNTIVTGFQAAVIPVFPNDYDINVIASSANDVVCASATDIDITFRNYGSQSLTSCDFTYDINGGTPATYNWTGNMASGATETVSITNVSFTPQATNTVNWLASNPNGNVDQNTTNNSISSSFIHQDMSGEVISGIVAGTVYIDITTDGYGSETTWDITSEDGTILAFGGPYSNNTTYNETAIIGSDCYSFNLYDSYGDGMCCTYGIGSVSVYDVSGNSIFIGDQSNLYSFTKISTFFSSGVTVPGCTDSTALNYDPLATIDDGSCIYPIYGCTDSLAANYDQIADTDDGSCLYCDLSTTIVSSPPSSPSLCDGFGISSSTSSFPIISYSWITSQGLLVSSNDIAFNLCTEGYIITVNDSLGCSTVDSLVLGNVYGCTNPFSFNFSWAATTDDGSCIAISYGCINPIALNFDSTANVDDGSCCLSSFVQVGQDINGESFLNYSGKSVSLSGDGNHLAIGSPNSYYGSRGHVRLYTNISNPSIGTFSWTQVGQIINGESVGDNSGTSVSLSDDGNTVAIGAPFNDNNNGNNSGHVRLYTKISNPSLGTFSWTQVGQDIDGETSYDESGYSVSLSGDGNSVAIGSADNDGNGNQSGHVRLYTKISNPSLGTFSWTQIGQDIDGENNNDNSGHSVSLSDNGNTVAIGAINNDGSGNNSGHIRVFENISGSWIQIGQDIDGENNGDQSGYSVSLSGDGNTVAIGATSNDGNGNQSGHVRIYENISGTWIQIGRDLDGEAANDNSGYSVSLNNNGNTVAIGGIYNDGNGTESGHVRLYTNISYPLLGTFSWTQIGNDIDGEDQNDRSGYSVSINNGGNTVAIGAPYNDGKGGGVNGVSNGGHVRIYNLGSSNCSGCIDPLALNYDSTMQYDDGSCIYYTGCNDPLAFNYDSLAIIDDGSCMYCDLTNTLLVSNNTSGSCNGFILANTTSSNLPISYLWSNGSTQNNLLGLCSGLYTVIITDNVGCIIEDTVVMGTISGCTDPLAYNFNSYATVDDGSCLYCDLTNSMIISANTTGNCDGFLIANSISSNLPISYLWSNGSTQNNLVNLCAGIYSVIITDNVGCTIEDTVYLGLISGCMDPLALNYDPTATVDDGSCTYASNCTSPKPDGLYAYDVIDTRAKVGWNNMNDANCMVWKYFVRYREVGTNGWTTKSAGVGNGLCNFGLNTVTKQLLNLTPSTTYEFRMKAFYCGGTSSNYSTPVQFTTADVCPDMTNLSVQTFTNNTSKAKFTWDTTGAYIFARITLRVDTAGASWQTAGGFGVYYPTLFVNKFGLQSGETYRAQGRTFCHPSITAYRSPTWTSPVFWTQPGTIRLEGGASINNLDIYPNPSRDIFNISFKSETLQDLSIRILNIVGAQVYIETKEQFVGEYTKQISLDNYGKGIYFLEIETNSGIVNKKLILQ